MKILIVEDEAPAYRRLSNLLHERHSDLVIVEVLDSIEQAVAWFERNPCPDLIFSDIQLADGLSFDIYQRVQITCPIVFTTAYDAYMLEAFRTNGIDYLLKPIEATDLERSIRKVRLLLASSPDSAPDFQTFLKALEASKQPNFRSRFLIKIGNRLVPVQIGDTAYFCTTDGSTELITKADKRYLLDQSLDQLEQELDPTIFLRVNRQTICKVDSITSVHPYFNGKLKLVLKPHREAEVIVSREKARTVRDWLGA